MHAIGLYAARPTFLHFSSIVMMVIDLNDILWSSFLIWSQYVCWNVGNHPEDVFTAVRTSSLFI